MRGRHYLICVKSASDQHYFNGGLTPIYSHMFTIAREWGLTNIANPCFGVRRNKETPRDYYAGDIVWNAVYDAAAQELKDAMNLAYLTGQRPADVLKVATTDLNSEFLCPIRAELLYQ